MRLISVPLTTVVNMDPEVPITRSRATSGYSPSAPATGLFHHHRRRRRRHRRRRRRHRHKCFKLHLLN